MPSSAHETVVRTLLEQPALLAALSERLLGVRMDADLRPDDSNLRAAPALEVRPDGVLQGQRPCWTLLEVQNRIDPVKRRSWPLAAAILLNQHGTMGDLVVLTTSQAVAAWAARAVMLRSTLGTRLRLKPAVVLITPDRAETLLDPHYPELALFAAWSVHRRRGPVAKRIIQRAFTLVSRLPIALRRRWMHAIVSVLGRRMALYAREWLMSEYKFRESRWAREFWRELQAEGLAQGRLAGLREALRQVLAARGITVTAAQQRRIAKCADPEVLTRWLAQAGVAASAREVFAEEQRRRAA